MRTRRPTKINNATPGQPDGAEATAARAGATKSTKAKRPGKVGRGQPPRKSQFKPGQSGNPGGRPPGRVSLKKAAENAFSRKLSYEIDGKVGRASMLEAVLIKHGLMAVEGDARSASLVLTFAAKALTPKEMIRSTTRRLCAELCHLKNCLQASIRAAFRARTFFTFRGSQQPSITGAYLPSALQTLRSPATSGAGPGEDSDPGQSVREPVMSLRRKEGERALAGRSVARSLRRAAL